MAVVMVIAYKYRRKWNTDIGNHVANEKGGALAVYTKEIFHGALAGKFFLHHLFIFLKSGSTTCDYRFYHGYLI